MSSRSFSTSAVMVLAFLSWMPWNLGAQTEEIEKLLKQLQTEKTDTGRVLLLNELGWELMFDNPDSARSLLSQALVLASSVNYLKGQGDSNSYRGTLENIHGNALVAAGFYEEALRIRELLNDRAGVAATYNNLGNLYQNQGDNDNALVYYLRSLRIVEALEDSSRVKRLYYNISIAHEDLGNYPEALDYVLNYLLLCELSKDSAGMANAFNVMGNIKLELNRFEETEEAYERALKIYRSLGNKREEASVLNNIGIVRGAVASSLANENRLEEAILKTEEALAYYLQVLEFRTQQDDQSGLATVFNNIGIIYKEQGSYLRDLKRQQEAEERWELALNYLERSRSLREILGDQKGMVEVYNGLTDVYRRQGKLLLSLEYAEKCLALAREINDQKFITNALKDMARGYYQTGRYKLAYEYRAEYDQHRYARINEKQVKSNERREVYYSDQKKQYEIERQQQEILLRDAQLKEAALTQLLLIGGTAALGLLILLLYNGYRIKTRSNKNLEEKNRIIEKERERSESLLLNILPASTAEELKVNGKSEARRYDSVSVLFTDFKSFTQIAEQLSPEELVQMLDECFRAFDEITARHGVEKIKTIGDAYMCASGLPTPCPDHAERLVAAALDMQAFMETHAENKRAKGLPAFETRIGIHSGPVVAGIVGSKKFAYDIWGDTVNLAARMEASGEPGKVNISETTHELVKHAFTCTPRGKVKAKNKGEQEMYFVESSHHEAPSGHLVYS
jgi:adenylate cyclase